MNRRAFLTLLGGTVAWPLSARAQQSGRLIRLGFLGPSLNNPLAIAQYQAFRTQLGDLGFREGQNLTIDYRGLDDPRGPFVVAAELVRPQPDLIVTAGPETSLQAVVGASGFIPVVIIAVNFDPLARGYIPGLARPGNMSVTVVVCSTPESVPPGTTILARSRLMIASACCIGSASLIASVVLFRRRSAP